jgi:cytochrome b561
MQIKNTLERFGVVTQLLHWSIVGLIITQVVLAKLYEEATTRSEQFKWIIPHKSIGMTVFLLAFLRLAWRLANPTPADPPNTKPWQSRVSTAMHWLLYALIFVTPLLGWLMSSSKNYSVSYFGLFTFPNLVGADEAAFERFKELHEIAAQSMVVLAILHALAAFKHHFIDKDNVLRRMLPMKLK